MGWFLQQQFLCGTAQISYAYVYMCGMRICNLYFYWIYSAVRIRKKLFKKFYEFVYKTVNAMLEKLKSGINKILVK